MIITIEQHDIENTDQASVVRNPVCNAIKRVAEYNTVILGETSMNERVIILSNQVFNFSDIEYGAETSIMWNLRADQKFFAPKNLNKWISNYRDGIIDIPFTFELGE